MEVQIYNYLQSLPKYKIPLFIHGIEKILKEIFSELKPLLRNRFILFLENFGISSRIFYYYVNGQRSISSNLLEKLLKKYKELTKKDYKEFLDQMFASFTGISSRSYKPISLPKFYSNELAYLTGFILGDGHISKRYEIKIWEETNEHAQYLIKLIETIFSFKPVIFKERNYFVIVINSAPIHFFFSHVLELPEGKKKNKEKIPHYVLLNSEFKINFLRGLFDSDGCASISKKGYKTILLSSTNKNFLEEIKMLTKGFDINFLGPYVAGSRKCYEIRIHKAGEIKKFNENIGFLHPIKNMKARLSSIVGNAPASYTLRKQEIASSNLA